MEFTLILSALYLLLTAAFCRKTFVTYALLTAFAFTVLSIELIGGLTGLTACVFAAATLLYLPRISIKAYDIVGVAVITTACAFWLDIEEFVDGYAYARVFVSLGAATVCNLLFDRQKRQSLCAVALLTSLFVCKDMSIVEIALPLTAAMVFTQDYTRSIDLMTIDSYGTSL